MNIDKFEAKTNVNKTDDYPKLKQKELELMKQYNSVFMSDKINEKQLEFKQHFLDNYKDFFANRNYKITEEKRKIIVTKIDVIITLEIDDFSFVLEFNNNHNQRYPFEISFADKFIPKPKHRGFLANGEVGYPGGAKNTNTTEYVINNIALLEEDLKNLEIPFMNLDYTDFVCEFNSKLDIPGEFKSIKEIIEAIPE